MYQVSQRISSEVIKPLKRSVTTQVFRLEAEGYKLSRITNRKNQVNQRDQASLLRRLEV
jgi:hypothetical protein